MSELQQFCMSCGGGISYTADQAGTDIFCMHCGHKNQLKSQSAQSHSPPPAPSMPGGSAVNEKDNDTDIYLLKNGVQDGPWKRPRITYLLGTGQIAPETMVWWEGKDAWDPLNGQTEIDFTQTAADQKQLMAPIDEEEAAAGERPPAHVSYNGQTFLADSFWLKADISKEVLPESLLVFYQPFSEWKPASEWLYAIELDEHSELEELEKEEYKPATSTPVADEQGKLSKLYNAVTDNGSKRVNAWIVATVILVLCVGIYEEIVPIIKDYASQQEPGGEASEAFMELDSSPPTAISEVPTRPPSTAISEGSTPPSASKPSKSEEDLDKANKIMEKYNEMVGDINKGSQIVMKYELKLPNMRAFGAAEDVAKVEGAIKIAKINIRTHKETCRIYSEAIEKLAPGKFNIPPLSSTGQWRPITRK